MTELRLSKESLFSVVKALVADELCRLRHADRYRMASARWQPDTYIGGAAALPGGPTVDASLDADSLELMALATRLVTFFRLHESGLEDYLLRYRTLGEWADLVATARIRSSVDITFNTSGSTGTPKQCTHEWHALVNEAGFLQARFSEITGQSITRVIALTPCHHIYGFIFSVVLPEYCDVPVLSGLDALAKVQRRDLHAGDLIIGVPIIWAQLSQQGAVFPSGVMGVSSSGVCDPTVVQALTEQGLQLLFEIYGSSETAGVGLRWAPDQAFELFPRWQSVTGDSDILQDVSTGINFPLGDAIEWLGERHFAPQGRKDNAVKVAGINVYPADIARRLAELPYVKEATVRLMTHGEGDRLKAFIVPTSETPIADRVVERVTAWCRDNLTVAERPKAFTLGQRLPVNDMGKPRDWPISASSDLNETNKAL